MSHFDKNISSMVRNELSNFMTKTECLNTVLSAFLVPLRYRYVTRVLPHRYLIDIKINVRFRIYNFLKRFITLFNDL